MDTVGWLVLYCFSDQCAAENSRGLWFEHELVSKKIESHAAGI